MAPIRGKRKRRASLDDGEAHAKTQDEEERLAQLRKAYKAHFETTFAPLPESVKAIAPHDGLADGLHDDEDPATDWEGLSDSQSEPAEVVFHTDASSHAQERSRDEHKIFMSSKPPRPQDLDIVSSKKPTFEGDEDAETDRANLKKDLALQRLLQESHLLDRVGSTDHDGETRHKALDMRFQKLGSKSSIYSQPKMPLAQRVGIANKAAERLETRRREARENGIVLEKTPIEKKAGKKMRERTIDAPSVGKFRKGMLTLSKKDVHDINGPKRKARR